MRKFNLFIINNVRIAALLICSFAFMDSNAQLSEKAETTEDKLDTLYHRTSSLMDDVGFLKKLRISGYVQCQYQIADTAGAQGNAFAGGSFDANVNNRFLLRRSRIKMS